MFWSIVPNEGEIQMNATAKTIVLWVALLLTAVLLYSIFSHPSDRKETEITFGKFMDEVNNKNVKSVKIADSNLSGQLVSGENFRTVVPIDYPALYDKLQGIDIQIEHATPNRWQSALISWVPFIVIIGFWIYFMRRFRNNGVLKNWFSTVENSDNGNVVQLEPDVAKAFPSSQSVNEALRLVIQLKHIPGTT